MGGETVTKNGIKILVKEGFVWLESDFDFPRQIIESPTGPEAMFERHKDQFNRFFNVSIFSVFLNSQLFGITAYFERVLFFWKYLKIQL